MGEMPKGAKEA